VIVLFAEPLFHFRLIPFRPLCPSTALPTAWADTAHHHALLSPSMMRTSQLQKPPLRTAEAQRRYRHRNALASGPDADAQLSREKTLRHERHAQVRARRSALLCPPTVDLACDATMNWTFTVSNKRNTTPAFAFTTAITRLAYRPLSTTPCRSTFPENTPLPILTFLHPAFVSILTGSAAPMQTGCPGLTHNP
jgi:hypothetical protein